MNEYRMNPGQRSDTIHILVDVGWTTLCGREPHGIRIEQSEAMELGGDLCRTCVRAAGARDIAIWNQEADETRTAKGAQIELSGAVREIPAKVFRVAGATDTYTVTVPMESGLNVTCDCRDGKIHPEKFCKHASAVLLSMQKQAS